MKTSIALILLSFSLLISVNSFLYAGSVASQALNQRSILQENTVSTVDAKEQVVSSALSMINYS